MGSNAVFYMFLVVAGVWVWSLLMSEFDRIHERWRYSISLFLALLGFFIGVKTIEFNTQIAIDASIEKHVTKIDVILKAKKEEIKEEVREEWGLDLIALNQDSMKAKIDSLDICIDKHFFYLNRRLDKLER